MTLVKHTHKAFAPGKHISESYRGCHFSSTHQRSSYLLRTTKHTLKIYRGKIERILYFRTTYEIQTVKNGAAVISATPSKKHTDGKQVATRPHLSRLLPRRKVNKHVGHARKQTSIVIRRGYRITRCETAHLVPHRHHTVLAPYKHPHAVHAHDSDKHDNGRRHEQPALIAVGKSSRWNVRSSVRGSKHKNRGSV